MRGDRIAAACLVALALEAAPARAQDVTDRVEVVGNPAAAMADPYARNLWDMQVAGGRLLLAAGGSTAAGDGGASTDLWSYDPKGGSFVSEHRAPAAWIRRLRPAGAGFVAVTERGILRRDPARAWSAIGGAPLAPARDVLRAGMYLYALADQGSGSALFRSADDGKSWKRVAARDGVQGRRLLDINGEIHVSAADRKVYAFDAGSLEIVETELFPGVPSGVPVVAVRSTTFRRDTVYLGGRPGADPAWSPAGLFVARDASNVRGVLLPGFEARDLLVRGKTLYVLASSSRAPDPPPPGDGGARQDAPDGGALPSPDGGAADRLDAGAPTPPGSTTWVWVLATQNLAVWEEILAFRADTFARSFELLKGDFYFGLGCDAGSAAPSCGRVLRVKSADWKAPPEAWVY